MKKRRASSEISLSFLDVICCGFGAVILLLLSSPQAVEELTQSQDGRVEELTTELFQIRGETTFLNRELKAKKEQISAIDTRIALARSEIEDVQAEANALAQELQFIETRTAELSAAKQALSEEEKRLLEADQLPKNQLIGGIPVDSEYIIFIIDTSGSMFSNAWQRMLGEMEATLNIYPNVKGIQVMNDMGNYLFSRYAGQWMPDTPARRQLILRNLANWNAFSNSSPVEGITQAVRSFYDRDKKISIYVFGDEFTGRSIEDVVLTVDRLNAEASTGERRVRIHAVGFPVQFSRPPALQDTGIRFATLMRELTHRNGGTFVGLNDFRP